MDNALCGGAGATLTGAALEAVKVGIFMGDPHYRSGQPYNVGTCTAQGVSCNLSLINTLWLIYGSLIVCRTSRGLPMLTSQDRSSQVLLRLYRPLLLHWQRCQLSPTIRQQVRFSGHDVHQKQDHCLNSWAKPDVSGETDKVHCIYCTTYIYNYMQSFGHCTCAFFVFLRSFNDGRKSLREFTLLQFGKYLTH